MKKQLFSAMLSIACVLSISLSSLVFADNGGRSDGIGISPNQTYKLKQQATSPVLFIDVRDPVEIMFVGFTDEVDLNIPFLIVDRSQWNAEKNSFRLYRNPDFIAQVEQALQDRGMDKSATIITMCRSGSARGLPSAEFLRNNGFENARYVVNGFQGSAVKDGAQKGLRIKNGWQNSGLPWGSKPNADKIFRVDR